LAARLFYDILHDVVMDRRTKLMTLTEEQRSALQAICRQRKVDALLWKRARAFLLLDAGYDAKTICEILDIGPTVLPEWRFAFSGEGLSFFGLKDYSQRQGHLSVEQERATQAHCTEHSARNADKVCDYILAEHYQSYSASGAAKLSRCWKSWKPITQP
jgi:transposase